MQHFRYRCLLLKQRPAEDAPQLCIFHAPVSEILKWASIRRLSEEGAMPQREKNDAKVRSIARFLRLDPRNTIPPAITISLGVPEGKMTQIACERNQSLAVLEIDIDDATSEQDKPAMVIDGQHRLLGMESFEEDPSIPIVALLNVDLLETAFQFIVINNKGSKVPTDHIRALVSEPEFAALETRLETARVSLNRNHSLVAQVNNDESSPFLNLINWPSNRTGIPLVVPAAIEASLADIQNRNVRFLNESEDYLLEFFFGMWQSVKDIWGDLWVPDSKLMNKAGMVAMNSYLSDSLINLFDWGQLDLRDVESVRNAAKTLLSSQTKEFWTSVWTAASLDTKSGRQLITNALVQIGRNNRSRVPWYTDVSLVDPTQVADEPPAIGEF